MSGNTGKHKIKPELTKFRQDPKVAQWSKSLNDNTRPTYISQLFAVCTGLGLTGSQLLTEAETNPKALSISVKGYINGLKGKFSPNSIGFRLSTMNSYLDFHEVARLPLAGLKIKHARSQRHPALSWEVATRIISLVDSQYQPIFKLMLWSMDLERVVRLNKDSKRIAEIKKQLQDPDTDFVKIDVPEGRKGNPDPYYLLVPRDIAAYLPVLGAGGKPIAHKAAIWGAWRTGLRRSGLPIDRKHGAHNLRSCWKTEATKKSLPDELQEHQLGHMVDDLNYQRVQDDHLWVLEQFRKAWSIRELATKEELDARVKMLEDKLSTLTEDLQWPVVECVNCKHRERYSEIAGDYKCSKCGFKQYNPISQP